MSRGTAIAPRNARLFRPTALVSVVLVLLFAHPTGRAQGPDALKFRTNFFLHGGFVVAGVNLRGTGGADPTLPGIAKGTIVINDVPPTANVLAAFLYWQTVLTQNSNLVPTGAKFNGHDISAFAADLVPSGTSPCWSGGGGTGSSGGAHRTHTYLADVLTLLPVDAASNKFLANGSHEIQLPDRGVGNAVPSTAGASLVVVYHDLSLPFTSIVVYDGSYSMDNKTQMMTQTIRGFYQASKTDNPGDPWSLPLTRIAKLTHIVADGANKFDRLQFSTPDTLASNTFTVTKVFNGTSATPTASDPAWDNVTVDVSAAMTSEASMATTTVDHVGSSTFDWR